MEIPVHISRLFSEEGARIRCFLNMPARNLKDAKCPAGLEGIEFAEIPFNNDRRVICISYGKSALKISSKKYCPKCPYNTDNLIKQANALRARVIECYAPAS